MNQQWSILFIPPPSSLKSMQPRPIRSQIYLPVLRFGITDEDWGIVLLAGVLGYALFSECQNLSTTSGITRLADLYGRFHPDPQSSPSQATTELAPAYRPMVSAQARPTPLATG
jgi:hypothetical protein